VRGQPATIQLRSWLGIDIAVSGLCYYKEDLVKRGYYLQERLHDGIPWQIYRATTSLPRQRLSANSKTSNLATEDEVSIVHRLPF